MLNNKELFFENLDSNKIFKNLNYNKKKLESIQHYSIQQTLCNRALLWPFVLAETRGRQKNPNPNPIPRFRKNESHSHSQFQKFSNSIPVPNPKFSEFNPNPIPKKSSKSQTIPRNYGIPIPKI